MALFDKKNKDVKAVEEVVTEEVINETETTEETEVTNTTEVTEEVNEVEEPKKEEVEEVKTEKTTKGPKEYIVKTKVANFNGIVAGIQFAYGEAKVQEGWILNWFKENGYVVEEVK